MMDYAWIRFINIYDYAYLAGVEPIASNYAAVFHFQGASQEQLVHDSDHRAYYAYLQLAQNGLGPSQQEFSRRS